MAAALAKKSSRRALLTDTKRLIRFLSGKDKSFSVHLSPIPTTRRRGAIVAARECDLFDDRLTLLYTVRPFRTWKALRRYKKFTIPPETLSTGECVLVKHDSSKAGEPGSYWKAKVLEIRALDVYHVYLRVAWLNRPEDLPLSPQPRPEADELFPSNEIDVIDATTVEGPIELMHWRERGSRNKTPNSNRSRYYWRLAYNYLSKQYYSTSFPDEEVSGVT